MTKSQGIRANAVIMSSTTPSAKYSCSGSPLMFWNGRTAIEGLSGSGSGWLRPVESFEATQLTRRRVSPGAHRLGNILQRLQTHVVKADIDLAADLTLGVVGNADASRLRDSFQTRSYVDSIAKNVVLVDDNVANVNADAKFDSDILR